MLSTVSRNTAGIAAAVLMTATSLIAAASHASAAPSQVDRTCGPGPRGNACAALFYDSATGRFTARGAVDPNTGHVISLQEVWLTWCYGSECRIASYAEDTPTASSGAYTVRWTPSVAGSRCYVWRAEIVYLVDRRDTYTLQTNGYGGIC